MKDFDLPMYSVEFDIDGQNMDKKFVVKEEAIKYAEANIASLPVIYYIDEEGNSELIWTIDDIDLETVSEAGVRYEVWALGYDNNSWCTDVEEFLFESPDKDEAVKFAKNIKSINDIFSKAEMEWVAGDYLEIVVETIANNDLSNANIETVFSKVIPCTEEV